MIVKSNMPQVNGAILVWARETAGLTRDEAVARLGIRDTKKAKASDTLAAFESSAKPPSRAMLVRMAKAYRRPLLTFYLAAPPRKGARGQDFRTLPADYTVADDALVDALIRDVRARQSMVRDALIAEDEAEPRGFVASTPMSAGIPRALEALRGTLRMSRVEFRNAATPEDAFKRLRDRSEAAGAFVLLQGDLGSHHSAISPETFRGFALADEIAPFVVVNDQDSPRAWSFTLLHEMVHLCLGETGVSGARAETTLERFCNDVASEFLLEDSELAALDVNDNTDNDLAERLISEFATARHLSRSMIAYRLYRAGAISVAKWRLLHRSFREQWVRARMLYRESAREREGGPSYYVVRRHRVGDALINFVRRMMAGGALTTTKAAKVLAVKPQNVGTLIGRAPRDAGRAA